MPEARLTRDEKKAQTRHRLIEAAGAVFARRGFAAASLDEIAEEAGLTKGAVYSNFAGKDELVLAVLDDVAIRRIQESVDEVDFTAPPEDAAHRAGALFMSTLEREATVLQLWLEFATYVARNPDVRGRYVEDRREFLDRIAEVIISTAADFGRDLPLPPEQLAIVFNALGNGLAIEKLLDPDGVPDELFGDVIALIYGIGAESADRRQPSSGTAPS